MIFLLVVDVMCVVGEIGIEVQVLTKEVDYYEEKYEHYEEAYHECLHGSELHDDHADAHDDHRRLSGGASSVPGEPTQHTCVSLA